MKRGYLFAVAGVLAVSAFVSCGGGSKAGDSDSVAKTEEAVEETFVSPDLEWQELKGNVASCTTVSYPLMREGERFNPNRYDWETTDSVTFSPDGLFTSRNQKQRSQGVEYPILDSRFDYTEDGKFIVPVPTPGQPVVWLLERDASGYITTVVCRDGNGSPENEEMQQSDTYTWEEGRLTRHENVGYEWSTTTDYTYDETGRVAGAHSKNSDMGEDTLIDESYTYLDSDDEGNWTRRRVEVRTTNIWYDPETNRSTRGETQTTWREEDRHIIYYPRR